VERREIMMGERKRERERERRDRGREGVMGFRRRLKGLRAISPKKNHEGDLSFSNSMRVNERRGGSRKLFNQLGCRFFIKR